MIKKEVSIISSYKTIFVLLAVGLLLALIPMDPSNADKDKGTFTGKIISLSYDLPASQVSDFTILDIPVLTQIMIENASFHSSHVSKHLFKGDGSGADISAHDNPIALIQVFARVDATVFIDVDPAYTIDEIDEKVILTGNELELEVLLLGMPTSPLEVQNSQIRAVLVKGSKLHIRLTDASVIKDKDELDGAFWFPETTPFILQGIYDYSIGAEATITRANGDVEIDTITFAPNLTCEVEKSGSSINIHLSSMNDTGIIVLISIHGDALDFSTDVKAELLMDGENLNGVEEVSSLTASGAAYYKIQDEEGMQLLIYVPEVSDNNIKVQFPYEPLWGFWQITSAIGMLAMISAAAIYIFLSRRD